ncbi:MAG: Holliday junction branch migration protein RuvA [Woeseiaceae bacterium]
MIGSLRGRLAAKQAPIVIIECGGVGYEVETPMSTYLDMPAMGEDVFIHIHMLVRDDAHLLFGFASEDERRLFRTLLKVSGVGAKMGLAILSAMTAADFARCVQHEDTAMLIKIPGIGKKTAERLIIEMRDKLDNTPANVDVGGRLHVTGDAKSEAMDALVSLGYKPAEVKRLLGQIEIKDKSAEDIIRLALRQVAS